MIAQIIHKPGELTEADYRAIDRLMNDCDNYNTIAPVPPWKYILGIAAMLSLIPLYLFIRGLSNISIGP
jgi:hypothetical protein